MIRQELCNDCQAKKATVFYGLGERCDDCAEMFSDKIWRLNQERHLAECEARAKHICGDGNDEIACNNCCDHEFDMDEGGYCINGCEKHYTD